MSENPTNSQSIRIPLYCFHSKFFLVEEIALNENYHELHYGRCCIIGKIHIDSSDPCKRFIENIRLRSLPKEYSLPEGTVQLRIITNNIVQSVPNGKICEIVGEVILYDTTDETANKVPLTSKDIAERLIYKQSKQESESEYQTFLLSKYQPAVVVDHIKVLERGSELAERNLEIKMLLTR